MTDIFFYQIPEDAKWETYAPFLCHISEERQERIGQMAGERQKILSLCAELLLRKIACERLGVPNDKLRLAAGAHGKPYLMAHEDFFFNWSHTGDALALAVAETPVGIDIEHCPPRGNVRKLAQRFFTKKEASCVLEASECELRFCELWTKKEAYTKYTGSGLTVALNSFDVTDDPRLVTLRQGDFLISLCCDSPGYALNVLAEGEVLRPPV